MATRVTATRFIGREPQLAELEAAFADAAAGHPSLAFVAGESGVGKTRLLGELERRARAAGGRVIGGDCVELGEGELPYAPLVAALRPLAREGDEALLGLPDAARAELATLAPELAPSAPAVAAPAPPRAAAPPRPDEERGAAQRRLFEALLAAFERLGEEAPLLLTLEDIHWADRSTRAFLAFLARSLYCERVLCVATYRSDELHRRHPLRPLLAELEREPRSHRIALARLDREELEAQLSDILGAPPQDDLVARLFARSEGNPLFTEELLAAGLDGRGGLPPTLRDALMVRVERLSDAAQEVLRLLACARQADHLLLADASGMEPRVLRDALREAAAGHIIVVAAEDRYAFRHALLREVVDDDLLPGERAALHLALAQALERRPGADGGGAWLTAAIAHHFRVAGDQPAALRASVRAAEEAETVHAPGEAAALLERALELWDRVPDAEAVAGADHVELLRRAASALRSQSDDNRRATLLELALSELDPAEEPVRVAAVLGELAGAQWGMGRGDASRDTLERAMRLLPGGAGDASGTERARLLAQQVKLLMLQSRYGEALEAADEAIEAIEETGAESVRPSVLNGLGVALICTGEHDRGVATLREAIALASAGDASRDLAIAYVNLADALNLVGRGREGQEILESGYVEMTPREQHDRWLTLLRAELALDLGQWDQAAAILAGARRRESGTALVNDHLRRAELALGRGEDEQARTLLDAAHQALADSLEPQFLGVCGALRGELERRAGDLPAARQAVEEALDRIEFCSEDAARIARVAAAGATVEADAAVLARDLGDPAAEADALARLGMLADRVHAAASEVGRPVEQAHLRSVEAEAARAAGAGDPARWAAAAAAWEAVDRPYPAALAGWRQAEAHALAGDRDAAQAALERPAATARGLRARWLQTELERLAARARLRGTPEPEPEGAVAAHDGGNGHGDPFGLTPRERQVLALVSRGATNREIGGELYMAEKTASVHVSRILAKLDVRSRTEAAAVAHRHGLAE